MIKPPDQIMGVAAVYDLITFAHVIESWTYRFNDGQRDNEYANIVIERRDGGFRVEAHWTDYWRHDSDDTVTLFSADVRNGMSFDAHIAIALERIRERILEEIDRSKRFDRYLKALTPEKPSEPEVEAPSLWERLS